MKITDKTYFKDYEQLIGNEVSVLVESYMFESQKNEFDYLIQASAVYSSNIEGNTIDLNSFMNYKLTKQKFKASKEIQEIENLISAYNYAKENSLTHENFLQTHKVLSETLLIKSKRGIYRKEAVGVFSSRGLVYMAIEPEFVKQTMAEFFSQIAKLISEELSLEEVFYYASSIHLKFAHIHPFMDGNGRAARLLEKWFLVEKLGLKYWTLSSEKYYKEHQDAYYRNINLGVNYYELDYGKCLPFLEMLPNSLKHK